MSHAPRARVESALWAEQRHGNGVFTLRRGKHLFKFKYSFDKQPPSSQRCPMTTSQIVLRNAKNAMCNGPWKRGIICFLSDTNRRAENTDTRSVCVCVGLYLPEPDDLFAVPCVMAVHSVPLPVLKVYLLHSTEHYL